MLKTASRLTAAALFSLSLTLGGCGNNAIFIDDQRDTSAADAADDAADTGETAPIAANDDKDNPPEATGMGSWWGIRHVKHVIKGDEEPIPAPAHPVDDNGEAAAADGDEDYTDEEEKPITHEERWRDPADQTMDPDFEAAMVKLNEGNYSEAKFLLLNVVKRQPNSSTAWRWLGESQYNLMELEEAIQDFQKALDIYPENYFAMRGEGFACIHLGHELWRSRRYDQAHEQYRKALKLLQNCTRIYPGDLEAMYGRSMAAEGASRRLYQNAITLLRAGKKEAAEGEARNCIEVIDEGIEAAQQRIYKNPNEIGPRNIAGGLYQRRAMLEKDFNRLEDSVKDMEKAVEAYESIQKIDRNNYLAGAELEKCRKQLKIIQAAYDKIPQQM